MLDVLATALDALYLALLLTLPALSVAWVTALLVGLIQMLTRLTEPSINAIVRTLSVWVAISLCGAWMGSELVGFTARLYARLPSLVQ